MGESWDLFPAEQAGTTDYENSVRAQRDIDQEPERYKHYLLKELPEKYHAAVDWNSFGPGERLVFEPYTREIFEHTHRWVASWQIFTGSETEQFRDASYTSAVVV